MAILKNTKKGLLLIGATALFLFSRANQGGQKQIISEGGGSGGFFAFPSGFGTGEVTSPFTLPEINIYESSLPNSPADDTKNMTKKESSLVQSGTDKLLDPQSKGLAGGYYDSSGKLVGVADPIVKQTRLPTESEKLVNTPYYNYSSKNSSPTKKENPNIFKIITKGALL